MKNVIALGKLIGLLFSSLPLLVLLSVNMHTKNSRDELARLVMGTTFLVKLLLLLHHIVTDSCIVLCFASTSILSIFKYLLYEVEMCVCRFKLC